MEQTTEEFFQELTAEGRNPLLGRVRGSARFDLLDSDKTDHWLVTIDDGNVTVSRRDDTASCTVRTDKAFFERVIRGEANAQAAVLRGEIVCTGDVEMLIAIQRAFPGPPHQRGPAGQRRGA